MEGEERAERSGVAAEPDHTGELRRRVAGEHGHEHGVGRVAGMDVAAGAPLGFRAAQRVAPAVGAAEALANEALGELRRHYVSAGSVPRRLDLPVTTV